MAFSPASHAHAAMRLRDIAERHCEDRMLAMGGGGYSHDNIACGWTAVVDAMVSD